METGIGLSFNLFNNSDAGAFLPVNSPLIAFCAFQHATSIFRCACKARFFMVNLCGDKLKNGVGAS